MYGVGDKPLMQCLGVAVACVSGGRYTATNYDRWAYGRKDINAGHFMSGGTTVQVYRTKSRDII